MKLLNTTKRKYVNRALQSRMCNFQKRMVTLCAPIIISVLRCASSNNAPTGETSTDIYNNSTKRTNHKQLQSRRLIYGLIFHLLCVRSFARGNPGLVCTVPIVIQTRSTNVLEPDNRRMSRRQICTRNCDNDG